MMGNVGSGGPYMLFPDNMSWPRLDGPRSQGFQQTPTSEPMMRKQQVPMRGPESGHSLSPGAGGGPNDQMQPIILPRDASPMEPGPGMIRGRGNVGATRAPNTSLGREF